MTNLMNVIMRANRKRKLIKIKFNNNIFDKCKKCFEYSFF